MRHGRIICGSCGQEMKHLYPRSEQAEQRTHLAVVVSLTAACSVALASIAWWAFA